MLDVGFSELLVFGIIALLVLGPEKLPVAARFAGKWYSKIKRTVSNVQNDIDRELRLSELREQMQLEMKRIEELEQKMQTQMQELQQQSIAAEEKQKHTAMTDNKSLMCTYELVKTSIPSPYISEVWIKQLKFVVHPIQRLETPVFEPSILKVAV
ncbi:twin-arginine translocase subunit TatB [Acinetobacter sp. R933-2]|uniref:Sec-independent protein translocase protein TatB n=1 Tax=Acinetobacter sp. R933-2 TaxID=2746728 RepID=UPI002575C791|nr:Sec-independent protein translocase protein TatB [Acinetobacter sp. R933-2]MDM1245899.1 twin-arginine translocase subunit TatB [Acinetobacter sp. R933-2]